MKSEIVFEIADCLCEGCATTGDITWSQFEDVVRRERAIDEARRERPYLSLLEGGGDVQA